MDREVFARMSLDVDDTTQLVVQVARPHRNRLRLHLLECEQGRLEIGYRAQISVAADDLESDELDRTTYLRPSRYADSDRLTAVAEEGGSPVSPIPPTCSPGLPLGGRTVGLRARQQRADRRHGLRPGLSPMDFHAVAVVLVDGNLPTDDVQAMASLS